MIVSGLRNWAEQNLSAATGTMFLTTAIFTDGPIQGAVSVLGLCAVVASTIPFSRELMRSMIFDTLWRAK